MRLTAPKYAHELLEASRDTELDLESELLEGRREEVHWQNMPEKVRALAVQRAHARKDVPGVGRGVNADDVEEDTVNGRHVSGTRRHKRRR